MIDPKLAAALARFGAGDSERALCEIRAFIAANPSSAVAQNALGSVLGASAQPRAALAAFEHALRLRPHYAEAACNRAQVLLEQGEIKAAIAAFQSAIGLGAPAQAHAGLGRAWLLLGRHADAESCFERVSSDPRAHAGLQSQRCYASLLNPANTAANVVSVHRAYQTRVNASAEPAPERRVRAPGSRLRIGYVSPDFREHSVACFIEAVLHGHDRSAVEVLLYSDVTREDATSARFRSLADEWTSSARLAHAALAQRIRGDALDVLVDLSGHMQANRLPTFLLHPAPLQLSYLGYPGTTGLTCFEGRISDIWADPEDDPEVAGPEPIVRVEGGCFAYTPALDAPEVDVHAPSAEPFTFGSMNDALKLNDIVLETWARILRARPGSRLLLKARAFAFSEVRERVFAVLEAEGVLRSRVELCGPTRTRREHLAWYARLDLALDTFPYAGATTTCEALYMGVPVVTLTGDRHASRMGTSILTAAGLPELVATSREHYVRLALALAADDQHRKALRTSLRERLGASPLFDGARIARRIEAFG